MSALGALLGGSLPEGWSKTECADCGVEFSSPAILIRRKDGKSFFCPNGHKLHFTENETDRLRKQVKSLTENRDYFAEQMRVEQEAAKWARADARRAKTKLRKVKERVSAGVCPECNRTFQQLARHMACKHKPRVAAGA